MQAGNRQLHLRLHTGDLHHPALGCAHRQMLQQRCLTYTGLTAQHQCPALPGANRLHQAAQHPAPGPTTNQPHHNPHRGFALNKR